MLTYLAASACSSATMICSIGVSSPCSKIDRPRLVVRQRELTACWYSYCYLSYTHHLVQSRCYLRRCFVNLKLTVHIYERIDSTRRICVFSIQRRRLCSAEHLQPRARRPPCEGCMLRRKHQKSNGSSRSRKETSAPSSHSTACVLGHDFSTALRSRSAFSGSGYVAHRTYVRS